MAATTTEVNVRSTERHLWKDDSGEAKTAVGWAVWLPAFGLDETSHPGPGLKQDSIHTRSI